MALLSDELLCSELLDPMGENGNLVVGSSKSPDICLKLPIVVLLTGVNQSLKLRGMSSEDGKEPVGDGHTGHRGM